MASALRLDSGKVGKAVRLDNGWLKAPAYLTRVGVFEYRLGDGRIQRELRLPEEVFAADSLATFKLKPLTDNHPPTSDGALRADAEATRKFSVGHTGENIAPEGRFLAGEVLVTDAAIADKVLSGKAELSCGYFADREHKQGVWVDPDTGKSHPYDVIQRNIRGDHVAIVDVGRAGAEVRIRLDSAEAAVLVSDSSHVDAKGVDNPAHKEPPTVKITIDGVEVDAPETVAQLVTKQTKTHTDALDVLGKQLKDARTETDKQTARADAAEAEVKRLNVAVADAKDPAKVSAAVSARVALETRARGVLGAEIKLDGKTDAEVRAAVVAKLDPEIKLDGKSADYAEAMFEAVLRQHDKRNPATEAAAREVAGKGGTPTADASDPRAAYEAAVRNAWKAEPAKS